MSVESIIDSDYATAVDTRLNSHTAYIEYQMHEARRALPFLSQFFDIHNARVLEVGAGRGGKGIAYALAGMHVISLDIDQLALALGAQTAQERGACVDFLVSDGMFLPFPTASFDAILLDSVIEHVRKPNLVLTECARVLKPGGFVFVVFPPFYGPLSGHIDDYVQIPWFHLLPRDWVERKLLVRAPFGILSPQEAFAVFTTLNRLTLFNFRRFARRAGFKFEYCRVRPFLTHPGTRLVVGLASALHHPPRAPKLCETFARARREFTVGTALLFVLLVALAPLVVVPILQEIAAGGVKCVLRKDF